MYEIELHQTFLDIVPIEGLKSVEKHLFFLYVKLWQSLSGWSCFKANPQFFTSMIIDVAIGETTEIQQYG